MTSPQILQAMRLACRLHPDQPDQPDVEPSPQQARLFEWALNGHGSAVLVAVAGSGKTTTIVALANLLNSSLYCTFVAFNKAVVEELKTRLPKHMWATTLNALGMGTWMKHLGQSAPKPEITKNKTFDIMRRILSQEQMELYAAPLPKLVALGKGSGIVPATCDKSLVGLTRDTDEVWQAIIDHYDVDVDNPLEAIDLARKVLVETIRTGKEVMDFDDQLYLPIIHRARFWQNDWLMVDEAQDVNKIQRAMLKRALRPGGRLVAVGDKAQAIYGFRGADTSSIDNIKKEFGAIELPLTVSYRCPQLVVREAQQHVSHIQAHPDAPLGTVLHQGPFNEGVFAPTDAILCRNTAPLVDLTFKLLQRKVGCRILGRAIGDGLVALIKKMKAKTIDGLLDRLSDYLEREVAKFMAKGEEQKAENLQDRVETIKCFIANLGEDRRTIPALFEQIDIIFQENGKGLLTLCTIHKSKGLEWQKVFILDVDLMPSKWARQDWQLEQEENLCYVAKTRSKDTLVYISSKQWDKKQPLKEVVSCPPAKVVA